MDVTVTHWLLIRRPRMRATACRLSDGRIMYYDIDSGMAGVTLGASQFSEYAVVRLVGASTGVVRFPTPDDWQMVGGRSAMYAAAATGRFPLVI